LVNRLDPTKKAFDPSAGQNGNSLAVALKKRGRATMKKNISIIMTTIAAPIIGLHPASASLLGMPINLKVAIELRNVATPAPACEFCTDDVLTGPLLVKIC
jgi:hypothetical protein